ncbi:DUF6624 domain-containing protein [Chryseobacterium sp. FH1]|uniref:DUF6624 domain-containing protein n=1 Tax=Chryseobacterium sp. FH1 TaxID=1233951 RepID=UPI0004E2B719|nr:DUF6624 domain-containing protein [Chryseobacterium sp. FH1]KFC22880.1 hypothetical protein IO90_04775 [Chryseobacterium sp. FH1]
MNQKDIPEIIIGLQNADLELREKLISEGKLGEGYNKEMENLHNQNAEVLNQIIDIIGFPTVEKVGNHSAYSAWLVIQHSIGKPEFMKKCAELLEIEVKKMKADPRNLAYLTDRIATFENKPQFYGTQFDWDENGELSPNAFDDIKKVDQRRKSIGLNTLEEQAEIIRTQAKNENHSPPKDLFKRKTEMENWKKLVGWIK